MGKHYILSSKIKSDFAKEAVEKILIRCNENFDFIRFQFGGGDISQRINNIEDAIESIINANNVEKISAINIISKKDGSEIGLYFEQIEKNVLRVSFYNLLNSKRKKYYINQEQRWNVDFEKYVYTLLSFLKDFKIYELRGYWER